MQSISQKPKSSSKWNTVGMIALTILLTLIVSSSMTKCDARKVGESLSNKTASNFRPGLDNTPMPPEISNLPELPIMPQEVAPEPPKPKPKPAPQPRGSGRAPRPKSEERSAFFDIKPVEERTVPKEGDKEKSRIDRAPDVPFLPPGTIINVVLETAINTDRRGLVKAKVISPVYDKYFGRDELIPQQSEVLGTYGDVEYGDRRVEVVWHTLVYPNGDQFVFDPDTLAYDQRGSGGIGARVNNHLGRIAVAVLAGAILSTGSRYAAGNVSFDRGISPEQEFARNASGGFDRAGDRIINRELNSIRPTLIVPQNTVFNILLQKRMLLEPYRY
jgi:type IV secretory pathway VirB10-like protein